MAKAKLNVSLIKQALRTKQANTRQATSHVKTRGEVSGGGKKPWKQKGTGRARAGSSRSPIWVGGGIVFGPSRERNYKLNLPKKMNRAAITQLLRYQLENGALKIVDKLALKEPKTKLALKLLEEHGAQSTVTIITKEVQPELLAGTNNLKNVSVVLADNVSVLDIAHAKTILVDKASAEQFGLVEKVAESKPKPKSKITAKKK